MACHEIILGYGNGARFHAPFLLICIFFQYLRLKFYANPHYSTTVESIRQIGLFLQNKANFPKSQVNVTLIITRNYERNIALDTW
jgi:hypothetical protein